MSKPKLIVMSGLPGSGKSTIAERIAKELSIPILSVDPIESAIIRAGIKKSFETGYAAYLIVESLAAEQLKLGQAVLVDAVNAEEEGKNTWRNLAKRQGAQLVVLETFLSDSELHRTRLKTRVRNLFGFPEIGWDSVQERRKKYTNWHEPTLKLDAVDDIEQNVKKAIRYIQLP